MSTKNNLRFWCLLGLILSLYATYVEFRLIFDSNFQALCDLASKFSCTAVFKSRFGRSFGLLDIFPDDMNPPNGVYGIIYYLGFFISTFFNNPAIFRYQLMFCVLSNILSIYLGYILYIMNNICVVCITIYVVNFFCLWEIMKDLRCLRFHQHQE